MVNWTAKEFGGEIPKTDPRLLPDTAAEAAWNCDMQAGTIKGLNVPEQIHDLSGTTGDVRRAYRLPAPQQTGGPDAWLPLPSEFSSVCRSPLTNDTFHRIYWTNPPTSSIPGSFWNTYARIIAGNVGANAPFNIGVIVPTPGAAPSVAASGGTLDGSIPLQERAYVYTFINSFGEESNPSQSSPVVAGAPDGTWVVSGLPTVPPLNPIGKNYPTPVTVRIYRTVVGATTGAQYFMVADTAFGPGTYTDVIPDSTVVNNLTLVSTAFANPVDGLDGLTAMPGGMLVGFTDNTVHFCEPDRPHAWPAAYDQGLQYDVVGMGVWQQSLIVLTNGFPSSGSGTTPGNFAFTTIQVPEPCIARGSILTDLLGVYYASKNGLIMLNYFGMQNQTLATITRRQWVDDFHAEHIIACRHRAQYLAINTTGLGFIIDYSDPRLGVVHLNTFSNAVCVWNDPYTGDTYVMADKKVFLFDSSNTYPLIFRWRSKQYYAPKLLNLGAGMAICGNDILVPPPVWDAPPMDNGDPLLVLPPGINAVLNVYAGEDGGALVYTKNLTKVTEEFRLPSGFKDQVWQIEIVGQVEIHQIQCAETAKELIAGG